MRVYVIGKIGEAGAEDTFARLTRDLTDIPVPHGKELTLMHGGTTELDKLVANLAAAWGANERIYAPLARFGIYAMRLRDAEVYREAKPDIVLALPRNRSDRDTWQAVTQTHRFPDITLMVST